jgi:parallel beta-helix repeat protein
MVTSFYTTNTQPEYHVTEYGVSGNGRHDNSPDLKALVALVVAAGGGVLLFPPGTFLLSQTLVIADSNIHLRGQGPGLTILKKTTSNGILVLVDNPLGLSDVSFRDLTLDGDYLGQASAGILQVNDVFNFLVDNVEVRNGPDGTNGIAMAGGSGGWLSGGSMGRITNCHVHHVGKPGIYSASWVDFTLIQGNMVHDLASATFNAAAIGVIGGQNVKIIGNMLWNTSSSAAAIQVSVGGQYPANEDNPWELYVAGNSCRDADTGISFGNSFTISDLTAANMRAVVTGNHLYNNRVGLRIENATNVVASNNNIHDNAQIGIILDASNKCQIVANEIVNCGTQAGIWIRKASDSLIAANHIYAYNGGTMARGVQFVTTVSDGITLVGNDWTGAAAGVVYSVSPTNLEAYGNRGEGWQTGDSVTATTPGSVTDKIEVFDEKGSSLGFLPVYDVIT